MSVDMGFAAAIAAMDDEDLVRLLERRPDLAHGNVWSLGQLAEHACRWHSQVQVLSELDQFLRRVFDLLVLAQSPATTDDVCAASGGLLAPAEAEVALERLAGLAMVWRDETGQWHLPGQVRSQLLYPAGLGRPSGVWPRTCERTTFSPSPTRSTCPRPRRPTPVAVSTAPTKTS